MSIGPNWVGHIFHYAQLTPKGLRRKDPHGVDQKPVEISFNYFKVDDWAVIRQNEREIVLGPEEIRSLTQLLVNRYPLDALGGVREDDDGN